MNAWLYLHFPSLLLDYQLALQAPEVHNTPCALIKTLATRRIVVQANDAARAQGVKVGMAEVLASTLAPELKLREYQPERESAVLKQLAQVLYQDIAQIVLHPPQGMLCEVRSLIRLHGGYSGVLGRIQHRLAQWPLGYIMSSGYSPLAAQLLAEADSAVLSAEVAPIKAAVAQLSIQQSGLPAQHIEQLRNVGMLLLGDVLQRPRAELGVRFGRAMTIYLAELAGEITQPQDFYQPPARFDESVELVAEVTRWPQLLFPLKRLLQQLESFLQIHQWSTRALIIRAHHRQGPATQVPIRFAHAVWQLADLLNLSQLHLQRQQLSEPVLTLSVCVRRPEPRQTKHTQMFNEDKKEPGSVPQLVSRLQARLGERAVQSPRLQDDWRPEQQGSLQCWQAQPKSTKIAVQRPCWLLKQAEPIERHQWQLQWGPERIASGWWDANPIQRDYYIALDQWQRQGWIYQSSQGWFLHGWFS